MNATIDAQATSLLRRAAEIFDAPDSPLATKAAHAWTTFFRSGAEWMRLALETFRGVPMTDCGAKFNRLGFVKYGLASLAALPFLVLALLLHPLWVLGCVPAFYAVEAQMVFLFPLVMDGSCHPFKDSLALKRRAGGTVAVMAIVLPLAATMLFGGFVGRGFVRSWCLGCLAVCLWYEDLRAGDAP